MLNLAGLAYETIGDGEPVLLIHGVHIADSFRKLMEQPALAQYRLIRYHRRGLGASSPHTGPFSFADQARDGLALLDALGVADAHLVGHSFGGCIALEMALQAPERVRSLILLDAAPLASDAADAPVRLAPITSRYLSGDAPGAVDAFLSMVGGSDWRAYVSEMVPGGPEQAARDAATFFEIELPAIGVWRFDAELASQITQPVLLVTGSSAGPAAIERRRLLHEWIAQAEDYEIGANHMLHMHSREAAAQVAEGIAAFLGRRAGESAAKAEPASRQS